ncbi:BTB/POZ domain protein [Ancylostoma caninum]|uniref:BTB/POZ domain protein n=1 Tax=Ancylostoma caninum TaxID=29170 RepID=A0A368GG59_ANCCA|nr:BTB/POZ domain protein [Ancylostoma caninum]
MSLQTDNFLGNFGFNFDFDACINVRSSKEGNDIGKKRYSAMIQLSSKISWISDEPVLAHRLVLSSASARFRNLLAAGQQESPIAKIDIDLREIPNSINAFKAMLSGLYTGELNFALADHSEILAVARHCEVPTIESKLLAASHQEPAPFAALFSQQKFPTIAPNPPCRLFIAIWLLLRREGQPRAGVLIRNSPKNN